MYKPRSSWKPYVKGTSSKRRDPMQDKKHKAARARKQRQKMKRHHG